MKSINVNIPEIMHSYKHAHTNVHDLVCCEIKVKVHLEQAMKAPAGECMYSSTIFLTSALDEGD
jgi:hypothetical protein